MAKKPVMIARPSTIRKAIANERAKRFPSRGPQGVKCYDASPSEFEDVRDCCIRKMEKLLESAL